MNTVSEQIVLQVIVVTVCGEVVSHTVYAEEFNVDEKILDGGKSMPQQSRGDMALKYVFYGILALVVIGSLIALFHI